MMSLFKMVMSQMMMSPSEWDSTGKNDGAK